MPKSSYDELNWILSLLAQRIAADQIIQEGAITRLADQKVFERGIRRCQLHTRLLQLCLQIHGSPTIEDSRSVDLVRLLNNSRSASVDIVEVNLQRIKPMVNVLADETSLYACLRIVIILLLLEDQNLKQINIYIRRRSGYVSVKFCGGKANNLKLLDKELIGMIESILHYMEGDISWSKSGDKRIVFMRLNLSSQLHFI